MRLESRIACFLFLFLFFSSFGAVADLSFTETEQSWLDEHRSGIRAGFAIIPPYLSNSSEDGEVEGISSDYLGYIEDRLNFDFDVVLFSSFPLMET